MEQYGDFITLEGHNLPVETINNGIGDELLELMTKASKTFGFNLVDNRINLVVKELYKDKDGNIKRSDGEGHQPYTSVGWKVTVNE